MKKLKIDSEKLEKVRIKSQAGNHKKPMKNVKFENSNTENKKSSKTFPVTRSIRPRLTHTQSISNNAVSKMYADVKM